MKKGEWFYSSSFEFQNNSVVQVKSSARPVSDGSDVWSIYLASVYTQTNHKCVYIYHITQPQLTVLVIATVSECIANYLLCLG